MGTLKVRTPPGTWTPILGSGQSAADVARWNASWGVVARSAAAPQVDAAAPTTPAITPALSFTFLAGRRYRLTTPIASMQTLDGSPISLATHVRRVGTTSQFGDLDRWVYISGNYTGGVLTTFFDGDGATYNLEAAVASINGTTGRTVRIFGGARLIIEDMGPVTQVSIAPPQAGPRVVASGNALGIVAMGAMAGTAPSYTIAVGAVTDVTVPLTFTPQVGRRYRLVCTMRATTATANAAIRADLQVDNVSQYPVLADRYVQIVGSLSYPTFQAEWIFDGDGQQHAYKVTYTPSGNIVTVYPQPAGMFFIEDVGPNMSPALPIPATPQAWTPLALASGWSRYDTQWADPAYRRIGDIVTVRGLAKSASGGSGTIVIGTLPAGFRPVAPAMFVTWLSTNTTSWRGPLRIEVWPNGEVRFDAFYSVAAGTPAITSITHVSFDGISFSTTG